MNTGAAAKVLTIEDEPGIRGGIVAYLEDSGFEMLQADNGQTGLQMFREQDPDVVLCDLRLPGMDGLELLSAFTAESPETPVIVVSGVGLVGDAVQALKRGAWDFVTKPIDDMSVLERAVHRVLERAELMRANRAYRETLESLNRDLNRVLRQFEEDQEAGRKMQFQLLPEDQVRFGEYAITRRLFPSTYLSGDFVDYFSVNDRHLGFYIADVSGHGAASAFVAVMLKTMVGQYREAYARDGDATILHPAQTLERLDRDLHLQKVEKHITMFYAVIDRKEHIMDFSSGGQFPFPLLHNGDAAHELPCRSRPVGLFHDSKFSTRRVPLPKRFVLLLASDGVLELLPHASLREKIAALHGHLEGPHVALQDLVGKLGLEKQSRLPDDVALLMVTRQAGRG